jgi:DNA-binding NtrC family response regulator
MKERTVLIVDDDRAIRDMLRMALEIPLFAKKTDIFTQYSVLHQDSVSHQARLNIDPILYSRRVSL